MTVLAAVVLTIASLNLPRHADKGWLVEPARRAVLAIRYMVANGVEVVGLQELATIARTAFKADPRWILVAAPPNNIIRGVRIGNAVAFQRQAWRRVGPKRTLKVRMPGRPRGLNMAAVLLEHRRTAGALVAVLAIHNPRRKTDPATNARALALEVAYARQLREAGYPVLVVGDFNRTDAAQAFREAGFKVVVRHVVDLIVGAGLTREGGDQVHTTGVEGVFTDHAMISGDVRIPARPRLPRRLPTPRRDDSN